MTPQSDGGSRTGLRQIRMTAGASLVWLNAGRQCLIVQEEARTVATCTSARSWRRCRWLMIRTR